MTQTSGDLLTESDAAIVLGGIAPRTLQQWRYKRRGPPYVRVGSHVRYRRTALEAWLKGRECNPEPMA